MFLDDLQWADAASLALLQPLLTSPDLRFLYLIGAYRDNEVDAGHLLTRTVAALEACGARVDRIFLTPLGPADLTRFAADCLGRSDVEIEALARLVSTKTEGMIQFLKTLWQEGLLRFDHEQSRWAFSMDDIAQAPMTDNVIDLMSRKIQRLSARTQRVLTLAACIGNAFDLRTLAIVSQQSLEETGASLREALDNGLLLRIASHDAEAQGEGTEASAYAFLHDRVQQAAYARLPEERRQDLHLAVGRLLLEQWDRATAEEKVFDIVGHLNLARALITDEAEQLSVARRNLLAGSRAKSSTPYQAALGYFQAGLELLPESRWSSDYALMFELHREAAECEYLCGQFDAAERRFEDLLARAHTALDMAQVYDLRVVQYENMSRYAEAARIGLEGLWVFGVAFPEDEDGRHATLEAEILAIEGLLAGRSIASLVELPVMDDPQTRMVMRLLTDMWAPAYISGEGVPASLISARMVSLSIEHGNTEDSAYGYVTHAIAVGPARGDYRSAYEWGVLALVVNDQKRRAKIHQQFNAHVTLWRRPLASCITHAREACRSGLQNGDFTYAGYGAFTESWPAFLISRDLDRYLRDLSPNLALLLRIRTAGLAAAHSVMLNWARALQGRTENPLSLSDASFGEDAYVAAHSGNPFFMTVFQIAKLRLSIHFEDYAGALVAAREARRLSWGRGTIWPVLLDFWSGLSLTALYPKASAEIQRSYWDELVVARDSLQLLAENCAENFRCFSLLLSAEMQRTENHLIEALNLYEEAIRYARQTESLQHEALAQELSGRLWLHRGNETVAAVYLGEARRCYHQWGAAAKVRQLEERYRQLQPLRGEDAAPSLDVASVTKAAHALSVEIVLEELLRKLMRIVLENASAERGFFLQEKEGHLVIEAEGSIESAAVSVLGSVPIEASTGLSRAVAQYVRKTGECVVIGDAVTDQRFAADPYMATARPKSILCMPVAHQGKFGGLLYLENTLTTEPSPPSASRCWTCSPPRPPSRSKTLGCTARGPRRSSGAREPRKTCGRPCRK
ncbi:MAG: GAF domain-containing protein [Gammaproteobacteria bacterium]